MVEQSWTRINHGIPRRFESGSLFLFGLSTHDPSISLWTPPFFHSPVSCLSVIFPHNSSVDGDIQWPLISLNGVCCLTLKPIKMWFRVVSVQLPKPPHIPIYSRHLRVSSSFHNPLSGVRFLFFIFSYKTVTLQSSTRDYTIPTSLYPLCDSHTGFQSLSHLRGYTPSPSPSDLPLTVVYAYVGVLSSLHTEV